MGVWSVGGELGLLFLDLDVRFLGSEGGDVSPGFEGVLLPWTRIVGGHPHDGRLRVREYGDRPD